MKAEKVILSLVCVALLAAAWLLWTQANQILAVEVELDKIRGAIGDAVAPPVPPAGDGVVGKSFEETLGGE